MTFTFVWDLDSDADKEFVIEACSTFEVEKSDIALVELSASLEQRLLRNQTPERLAAKPSKRDIEWSESNIMDLENNHRMNSNGENLELPYKHLVIDNTNMSASETAKLILGNLGVSPRDA
ncbi:hypothetical protein N9164_16855 [Draconibacterium sp.]|nr:hypothetical protein [Draconibacterium sp.]